MISRQKMLLIVVIAMYACLSSADHDTYRDKLSRSVKGGEEHRI